MILSIINIITCFIISYLFESEFIKSIADIREFERELLTLEIQFFSENQGCKTRKTERVINWNQFSLNHDGVPRVN